MDRIEYITVVFSISIAYYGLANSTLTVTNSKEESYRRSVEEGDGQQWLGNFESQMTEGFSDRAVHGCHLCLVAKFDGTTIGRQSPLYIGILSTWLNETGNGDAVQ